MRAGALTRTIITVAAVGSVAPLHAAAPADRRPIGVKERDVLTALLDAVDAVQRGDRDIDANVRWDSHVMKSLDGRAYVPFAVSLDGRIDGVRSGAIYVRAVSRRPAAQGPEQRSDIREWLARGPLPPAHVPSTVYVPAGELPIGGPPVNSRNRDVQTAVERSMVLNQQVRQLEKERAEQERLQREPRDPSLFPFEDYYYFESRPSPSADARVVARALALPPGEYDLYVALVDRERAKDARPVVLERHVAVPDFWNGELRLSSLILTGGLQMRRTPLARGDQGQHPYTFGLAETMPATAQTFSADDVLSLVFQVCNYGAPHADFVVDYAFYRIDGSRRLFNGTKPQQYTDSDLPKPDPWETQAFAMQSVPLKPFPSGQYEVEVTVRDRLTRSTAKGAATFVVK
jgi:hypothetical protein